MSSVDRVAALIDAARAFGSGVLRAEVSVYATGNVAVRIQVGAEDEVAALAAALGCGPQRWVGTARTKWVEAERGTYGDPLMVTVVGEHQETSLAPALDTSQHTQP